MSAGVRQYTAAEIKANYEAARKRLTTKTAPTWKAPECHLLAGTYRDGSIDEVDQRVHPEPMPEFDYGYSDIPIECRMAIAAVEREEMEQLRGQLEDFDLSQPDWWKSLCLRIYELPILREREGLEAMEILDPEHLLDSLMSTVVAQSLDVMNRKNQPLFSAEFALLVKDAAGRTPNVPEVEGNYPPLLSRAIHAIYIWTLLAGTATIRVSGVALANVLGVDRRAGGALLSQMTQKGWLRLIRKSRAGNSVSTWRWKGYLDNGKLRNHF